MVQFDNCARDNKNRWLLAFFAHLIHKRWLSSVEIYYLAPGHSHDMVDRECFSPLGHRYRNKHSFWTPPEFPAFLNEAWRRRERKPIVSTHIAVCDWKAFFNPHLRTIENHSHPRAYLLKRVDTETGEDVHLFYKSSVLAQHWVGYQSMFVLFINQTYSLLESTFQGMSLLKSFPHGTPTPVLPQPIPEKYLQDIPSLSTLPAYAKTWWQQFRNEQFSEDCGKLTLEQEEDFWCSTQQEAESDSNEESTSQQQPPVRISHHPLMPWNQLELDSLVALRPDPSYIPSDGELSETFWIGKVCEQYPEDGTVKIQYYVLQSDKSYDLLESSSVVLVESVLHSNIQLTKRGKLYKKDIKKILKAL